MTRNEFEQRGVLALMASGKYQTSDGVLDVYNITDEVSMMADYMEEKAGIEFDDDDFETTESLKTLIGQLIDNISKLVNDDEGNSVISAIHEVVEELKTTNERLDDLRTGSCVEIKNP